MPGEPTWRWDPAGILLLADYEALGVQIGLGFWFILTAAALALGLTGAVAGSLRPPWPKLAGWLGATALILESVGVAVVWYCFGEAQALGLGRWVRPYRPGPYFWGSSILAFALGAVSLRLGLRRRIARAARVSGPGRS